MATQQTQQLREKAEALSRDALDKGIDLVHLTKEDKRIELSQKLWVEISSLNEIHDKVKAKIEDKTISAIHDLRTEIEGKGITWEALDRHIIAAAIIESGHEVVVREAIDKKSTTSKPGTILSYIPKQYAEQIPDIIKPLLDVKPSVWVAVVWFLWIFGAWFAWSISTWSAFASWLAIWAGFIWLLWLEKFWALEWLFGGLKSKVVLKESLIEKQDRETQERTLVYRETLNAFLALSPLSEPVISSPTKVDYIAYTIKNWRLPPSDSGTAFTIKDVPIKDSDIVLQTLLNPKISSMSIEQLRQKEDELKWEFPQIRRVLWVLWQKKELFEKLTEWKWYDFQKVPLMSLFLWMTNNLWDVITFQNFINVSNFGDIDAANIYWTDSFLETRISERWEMIDVYSILRSEKLWDFKAFNWDVTKLNADIELIHKNHPNIWIMGLGINEKSLLRALYPLLIKSSDASKIEKKLIHLIEIIKFWFDIQKSYENSEIFNITTLTDFDLRATIKSTPLSLSEVLKLYFITWWVSDFNKLPSINLWQIYLFVLSLLKKRNENLAYWKYWSQLVGEIFKWTFWSSSKIPPSLQEYIRKLVNEKKLIESWLDWAWSWLAKWWGAAIENPVITTWAIAVGVVAWKSRWLKRWHVNTDWTIKQ